MKSILILSNSARGLFEFRRELIRDLLTDHIVYLSLPDDMSDRYMIEFKNIGAQIIHTVFDRRGTNPAKDIKLYKTYKKIMQEIKPDLVLSYTIKPNIYGGMACKSLNIPYISNITGLGTAILSGGLLGRVLVAMYNFAIRGARCVFFQNSYNMNYMTDRGLSCNGDIRLLPGSGVNLLDHPYIVYPSEENGIKFLSVMRIMKDKGIEELLDAVNKLASKDRVHFILAGSYEEETRHIYEPTINELVDLGKLSYLGFVDDMNPIYAGCHAVIHPSYHEGLSNVCLEAAACGRPIITTDIPGCKETVNDESGVLCQPRSAGSLYDAIEKMLALTADERKAMGVAGRKHVEENFDRNIVISAYREYI